MYEDLAPIALDFANRLSEVIEPADRAAFERAIDRLTERSAKLAAEFAKGQAATASILGRCRSAHRVPEPGVAMKHYTYFRSSAAYRVRIALNLKGSPPSRSRSISPRTAASSIRRNTARSIRSAACRRSCSTTARC